MNHVEIELLFTLRNNLWLQPEFMSVPVSPAEFKNGDTSSVWKGRMSTKDDFPTDTSSNVQQQLPTRTTSAERELDDRDTKINK